jgi:hypothetical protein
MDCCQGKGRGERPVAEAFILFVGQAGENQEAPDNFDKRWEVD